MGLSANAKHRGALPFHATNGYRWCLSGCLLRNFKLKPELKGAALVLLCEALLALGVWIFIGMRVGIWTYNEYDRYIWLTENLHIAQSLWRGEIKAGEGADKLINMWHPHELERFGDWTRMDWYPGGPHIGCISLIGICVIAKDGVLVEASYYTDDGLLARGRSAKIFFNTMSPEVEIQYQAAFRQYVNDLEEAYKQKQSSK